ncbi:MAG: hypothetical protein FJ265_13775 [Planctomycetes bacterium]|nr:hypothetical protein [Planctomycetota bacterium]
MTPAERTAADQPAPAADPRTSEWLLTDGTGGYGCGTAADLPTRRYHGLWTVREPGGPRRYLAVAGLDERLGPDAGATSLLHARWAGLPEAVPPPAAVSFAPRPWPCWTFRGADAAGAPFGLERSVLLVRGGAGRAPSLLVRWRNLGDRPARCWIRPLLGWCDADHLLHEGAPFDGTVHRRGASWGVRPDGRLPVLWLTVDGAATFRGDAVWYRGFLYELDRARGYDHVGDRWSPGVLEVELGPGREVVAAFAFGEPLTGPAAAWGDAAAQAGAADAAPRPGGGPLWARLCRSADDFLYRGPGGRLGVLAGFPWFGEWGRDVFVSLPGLTLARGRGDLCAAVLDGALPFLRGGLLPNIYGRSAADSHYGSCDAALWFALAVQRYADAGGDPGRVQETYVPALRAIADAYVAGTGLGMVVDTAGLLRAGGEELNATWMDARTGQGPVTPRSGQPVEIQALWYALLAFLAERGEAACRELCGRCGAAFVERFWLPQQRCLADRWHGGEADATVRPNMVVAAALARSPLTRAQREAVVQKARAELLTPRGLRTLSPRDPAYRGRYEGPTEARDLAYHQGTAWPWLLGFYVEAALRAAARQQLGAVRGELGALLQGFLPELDAGCLGHVAEVYDGDPPQRAGGAFAQAWSTAELLRGSWLVDRSRTVSPDELP